VARVCQNPIRLNVHAPSAVRTVARLPNALLNESDATLSFPS